MLVSVIILGRSRLCFVDAGRRGGEDGSGVVCRGAGAPAVHHIHRYVCAIIVSVQSLYVFISVSIILSTRVLP